MSFWGMDTEQVLSSADAVERAAGRLEGILDQLQQTTLSAPWEGPDADAFRDRWQQVRTQGEAVVLPELRDRSRVLAQHVQEQDRASDEAGGDGFWDGVSDFFGDLGSGAATLIDTVEGGVRWLSDRAGEGFDALMGTGQALRKGATDYVTTLGGNIAETMRTPLGMVENLLTTGRWPTLTELAVGGIDFGLDSVNTLVHAMTGVDTGLADDGNGYADAPQQIVPGQDGAPDLRDPTSVADIVHNTNAGYGDAETGEVAMTVVRDDSGEVTGVVATVPGTEQWSPVAGDNPMDLTGNAAQAGPAGHSAGAEATADAIGQLYRDHGIPPDTPLMISGHSQGGMIAGSLAADQDFASRYNLASVMSYGAPVDNYAVNPDVAYLHFQHDGDPVPMIDAGGFPYPGAGHPNVETITLPGPHDGLNFDNHGSSAYYDSIDATGDAHRSGLEQFLVGAGGSADHYTSGVHRDN